MKENEQKDKSLINNSVNANIRKFRVAFEFESQVKPLIIELSFDEQNKKILPDNKYFDKMYDNLKSRYEFDIKQVALKGWNKYLESKIKDYHAQISEYPADNYGDYLILVLFLEMVQYHWAENKLDQKNIWYNVESLQDLSQHFPRQILNVSSNSHEIAGGERFNNCADYLKNDLVKIVFIDDFPMEVVPQLFKLQNFCTKPLEVDVTSFNFGKKIRYNKNDNKNRTEKVVKEVRRILGIKDDVTDPENSVESNLQKKEAVSKLKFVGQTPMSCDDTQISWFQNNFCGFSKDKTVHAEGNFETVFNGFDPDINRKKYAPFLDPQIGLNSIETVEPSNNLNEVNKPESDTVDTIHDPHTEKTISFRSFKDSYLGLNGSEVQEEQKDESKTKTQKNKGQLMLTWAFLILCGIIFIGAPSGAVLFGVSFGLKEGITVVGIMIFSGLGFGFLLAELRQQNLDISLSDDNLVDYNSQEVKSQEIKIPLLENGTKNKDVSNELNDKNS